MKLIPGPIYQDTSDKLAALVDAALARVKGDT